MKQLYTLANNAAKLSDQKIFLTIVSDKYVQSFIIDLNRKDQLFKEGVDADNKLIGVYSAATEVLSAGQTFEFSGETKTKEAGQPIFLYDTGRFFKSFKVRKEQDGIYIEANAITIDGTDLTKEYGKQILGLSNETKPKLAEEILVQFVQEARKSLFKGVKKS
jgi:hypothetical protein